MVLNGSRLTANGFHFKRLEDCVEISSWDIPYPEEKKILRDDGVVYGSIYECADSMNTRIFNISRVLRNKRKTYSGYSFKYLEE